MANSGQRYRGRYGHYNVTRLYTQGDITADSLGLFIQDAWTINNRLTLNLGVRTEREDVPSYRPENPGIDFGFGQKIAPRVGFAWDVKGDSSLKAYGSWGFYDQMKLTLGRIMFGADRWMNCAFYRSTRSIGRRSPAPIRRTSAARRALDVHRVVRLPAGGRRVNDPNFQLVDPDLHPIAPQEFTLGLDRELTKTMSVGVRYVHKWIDYAIEAVCELSRRAERLRREQPWLRHERSPVWTAPAAAARSGASTTTARASASGWRTAGRSTRATCSDLRGNWSGIASPTKRFAAAYSGLRSTPIRSTPRQPVGRSTDRPHQLRRPAAPPGEWCGNDRRVRRTALDGRNEKRVTRRLETSAATASRFHGSAGTGRERHAVTPFVTI